jgi:uncharacterized protein
MSEKSAQFAKLPTTLQKFIDYLIQSLNVTKIVLFGSRARGTARDNSDYDFAIWLKERSKWPELIATAEEQNFTLLPCDFVIYNELPLEYKKNIDREGLLIYGEI